LTCSPLLSVVSITFNTLPLGEPGGFNFFKNLGVKGSILSVADDLMKNEGKKFLEMMEKLAERRIRKDLTPANAQLPLGSSAQHIANPLPTIGHHNLIPTAGTLNNSSVCLETEEADDDSISSELDSATEEQRLEEGKRMFQMFAAKMFEQRILSAYREKGVYQIGSHPPDPICGVGNPHVSWLFALL